MERMKKWKNNWTLQALWEEYSVFLLFVLTAVLFNIYSAGFLSLAHIGQSFLSNIALMIVVLGVSFVMIGGGIDLSVGYQISLSSVVIALLSTHGFPDWVVFAGALLTGVLCGLLNGVLIGVFGIVPFAATIATQIIFRGLSFVLSNGSMVSYISDMVRSVTRRAVLGIRGDLWLLLGTFLVSVLILHFSFLGKYIRAIGLEQETARRAGVKVGRVQCISYALAGLFYAIASVILTSTRGYAGSEIGIGMEISGIVAAYIGGVLGQARKLNLVALLCGALTVGVIERGLPNVGINVYVQYIITGMILIVSMGIHRKRK